MNIIELFKEIKIDKNNILLFSAEDIIRVQKQINVERRINPEIDSKTSENLILALKEYKEELLFVLSNRILFNFLTHNNLAKNHFLNYNLNVSEEKMKRFIGLFLADDLISFFSLKLSKNWYHYLEELDLLLNLKRYFPEEIILKITLLLYSKLDFAISQLAVSAANEFSNIAYIKYSTFYDLLSHFATVELDRKMTALLSLVIDYYKKKTNISFFNAVIKSMASYNAFDESINHTLTKNRDVLIKLEEDIENKKTNLDMGIMLILIFLLILFFIGKYS